MEPVSIAENLFFNTVRIETKNEKKEPFIATSFIVEIKIEERKYVFLVTNKHVIDGMKSGSFYFILEDDKGKPLLGRGYKLDVAQDFEKEWFGNPNPQIDVAVCPLQQLFEKYKPADKKPYIATIPPYIFPSEEMLKELDALEEIVFVGYPKGLWDTANLLPIIRKGITASPVCLDFQGQPQFLVDASVFPGSSGSPVFIYNVGWYYKKPREVVLKNRLIFLGVLSGGYFQKDKNEIVILEEATKTPFAVSKQMINLGIVFKSSTIIETIEIFLREKGVLPKNKL
jgi:hypothetical protein